MQDSAFSHCKALHFHFAIHNLEIIGETEVVNDLSVINWLAQQKGPLTVETDMVMLKISAQKVKLVESSAGVRQ